MTKYSKDQIEQVLTLREEGKSLQRIEQLTGVHRKSAYAHCVRQGVYPQDRPPRRFKGTVTRGRAVTPEEDAKIQKLALEGKRPGEIAEAVNRPFSTIRFRLSRAASIAEACNE